MNVFLKWFYVFILIAINNQIYAQNFPIGHTTITFNDPTRSGGFGSGGGSGRQIQTEIYYPSTSNGTNTPVANGTFPIIVFGHGFAMSWDAYENIWEDLVAKGYIMAFPRTEGSLLPAPSHANFGLDLALVEIKMQALNSQTSSIFYQKIRNKSALMGHSMGGGATFLGAASSNSTTLKAVVGLAPAETNPSAINAANLVNKQTLIFSGSSDGVTPPNTNHLPIYNQSNADCKTFISIINGSHCYFANTNFNCDFGELTTGSGSLSRAKQQDITSDFLTLWLDYQLKNNCTSWTSFQDSLAVSQRINAQQSCTYVSVIPTVEISGVSHFCANENINLVATSNPNFDYTWYYQGIVLLANDSIYTTNQAGTYQVAVVNQYLCTDSSNVHTVSTWDTYLHTETIQRCEGDTFIFPDANICSSDTIYNVLFQTINQCDSLVTFYVTFLEPKFQIIDYQACKYDSVTIDGVSYYADTSFSKTYATALYACDSIVNFNIHFQWNDTINEVIYHCLNEEYVLPDGVLLVNSGNYYYTYPSNLCDSVYHLEAYVSPAISDFDILETDFNAVLGDTFIVYLSPIQNFDSIYWSADYPFAFLQTNNDTAMIYIANALQGQQFISAAIFEGNCNDTAQLIVYANHIFNQNNIVETLLYPNPTSDFIYFNHFVKKAEIFDVLGRKIMEWNDIAQSVSLSSIEKGVYKLKIANQYYTIIKN